MTTNRTDVFFLVCTINFTFFFGISKFSARASIKQIKKCAYPNEHIFKFFFFVGRTSVGLFVGIFAFLSPLSRKNKNKNKKTFPRKRKKKKRNAKKPKQKCQPLVALGDGGSRFLTTLPLTQQINTMDDPKSSLFWVVNDLFFFFIVLSKFARGDEAKESLDSSYQHFHFFFFFSLVSLVIL